MFLRRHVSAVTANSRHTAERTATLYRVPRRDVSVVYNGLAQDGDEESEPGSEAAKVIVAFVGRLVGFKRVDRLLEAAALIDTDQELEVLVVGGGPLEVSSAPSRDAARSREGSASSASATMSPRSCGVLTFSSNRARASLLAWPSSRAVRWDYCQSSSPTGRGARGPATRRAGGGDVSDLAAALKEVGGSPALSPQARRARSVWVRRTFPIEKTADAYESTYRMVVNSAGESTKPVRATVGVSQR